MPPTFSRLFAGVIFAGVLFALFVLPPTHSALANAPAPQARSSAPNVATGRRIFSTTCAACHGIDGRGGEHAPNIATRPEIQRLSDQQLFHIVHDGSGPMPAFGTMFSTAQIRGVVQYLRFLQGSRGPAAMPGDPKAGKVLFFGKAGCSGCHMVQGQGGFIAADLTDFASTKSADEIREAIVSPAPDVYGRGRLATVTLKSGEAIQGIVRNEDNFSLQLQSLDGSFHLLDKSDIRGVAYSTDSLMPSDYAAKLTSQEINAIVSYLMSAAPPASALPPKHND